MSVARMLLCALVLSCSVDALAATPSDAAPSHVVAKGKAMRTTGIVLTSVGGVLAATGTGIVIWAAAQPPPDPNRPTMGAAIPLLYGSFLDLTSLPFLGAGIPLWAIGNHKLHAAKAGVGLYRSGDETRVVLAGRW